MSYKSVRLLNEAIHSQMDALRKLLMAMPPEADARDAAASAAQENLIELRKLFDELAAKADRPTIDDVTKLSPGDYVATMKPLVGLYHRQLMAVDKLAPALCEDLQAGGAVLILLGIADDGKTKTFVRMAHDPDKPEVALAVETLLAAIDEGTRQVVAEGVAEAEKQLGVEVPESPQLESVEEPTS